MEGTEVKRRNTEEKFMSRRLQNMLQKMMETGSRST